MISHQYITSIKIPSCDVDVTGSNIFELKQYNDDASLLHSCSNILFLLRKLFKQFFYCFFTGRISIFDPEIPFALAVM